MYSQDFSSNLKHLNLHHSLAFAHRADIFFENGTTGWSFVYSFLRRFRMDPQYFSTSVFTVKQSIPN